MYLPQFGQPGGGPGGTIHPRHRHGRQLGLRPCAVDHVSDTTDPVEQGNTITYRVPGTASVSAGADGELTATVPGNTNFVSASGGVPQRAAC